MDLPQRTKIRMEGYDYSSQGAYFITICVTDRHALLWDLSVDIIQSNPPPLSQYGMIVEAAIQQIPAHYRNVCLDKFCIMPDHVHIIVFILPDESRHHPQGNANEKLNHATISTLVGSMKRWVSKQLGFSLWQKSFHDRVLWNQRDYHEVWEYIDENPIHYAEDRIDDSPVLPRRSL